MRHESPPEHPIEQQLAAVELPPLAVDRDRLMYQAGWQAAVATHRSRTAWLWPASTVVATAASIALAVMLVRQPLESAPVADNTRPAHPGEPSASAAGATNQDSQLADTTSPVAESDVSPWLGNRYTPPVWLGVWGSGLTDRLSDSSVLGWRSRVTYLGVEGVWPQPAASASPAYSEWRGGNSTSTSRELLEELLRTTAIGS